MPTAMPRRICNTTESKNSNGLSKMTSESAMAIASSRNGKAIPSLRPLSMFNVWRIRTGTLGLLTTLCPRLASVGARITPKMAASQKLRSVKIKTAAMVPKIMVSGSPNANNRVGRL